MKKLATVIVVLSVVACQDTPLEVEPSELADLGIVNANHTDVRKGFHFMPPIGRGHAPKGEFDSDFLPFLVVEICELVSGKCVGDPIERFTSESGRLLGRLRIAGKRFHNWLSRDRSHYSVLWNARRHDGRPIQGYYRIRVLVNEMELGHADISVKSKGARATDRRPSEYPVFQKGRVVPIRFRVTTDLRGLGVVGASGGAIQSEDGAAQLVLPTGALDSSVVISVHATERAPNPLVDSSKSIAQLDLMPSGLRLQQPATLIWNYGDLIDNGVDLGRVGIVHARDDLSLVEVVASSNDPGARRVTFDIYDFSNVALREYDLGEGVAVFLNRWTVPIIKWHLDKGQEAGSDLSESIVQAALDQWSAQTSSFKFAMESDRDRAHLIFRDVNTSNVLSGIRCNLFGVRDFTSHIRGILSFVTAKTLGQVCYNFAAGVFSTAMDEGDFVEIQVATKTIKEEAPRHGVDPDKAIFKSLRHEIGHALGLAHPWKDDAWRAEYPTDGIPIMRQGLFAMQTLHRLDIQALLAHYRPPEPSPSAEVILQERQEIQVPGLGFYGLALAPDNETVTIPDPFTGAGQTILYDLSTQAVKATVDIRSFTVASHPTLPLAYVGGRPFRSIMTDEVPPEVREGPRAAGDLTGFRLSPNGSLLFARDGQSLVAFDSQSLEVRSEIDLGGFPEGDVSTGFDLSPDGRFAYLAGSGQAGDERILEVDLEQGVLTRIIEGGAFTTRVVVDPNGSHLWALGSGLRRIDLTSGEVTRLDQLAVSSGALDLRFANGGTYVFVSVYDCCFTGFDGVVVLSSEDWREVARARTPASPATLTISSDERLLAVRTERGVSVFDITWR